MTHDAVQSPATEPRELRVGLVGPIRFSTMSARRASEAMLRKLGFEAMREPQSASVVVEVRAYAAKGTWVMLKGSEAPDLHVFARALGAALPSRHLSARLVEGRLAANGSGYAVQMRTREFSPNIQALHKRGSADSSLELGPTSAHDGSWTEAICEAAWRQACGASRPRVTVQHAYRRVDRTHDEPPLARRAVPQPMAPSEPSRHEALALAPLLRRSEAFAVHHQGKWILVPSEARRTAEKIWARFKTLARDDASFAHVCAVAAGAAGLEDASIRSALLSALRSGELPTADAAFALSRAAGLFRETPKEAWDALLAQLEGGPRADDPDFKTELLLDLVQAALNP